MASRGLFNIVFGPIGKTRWPLRFIRIRMLPIKLFVKGGILSRQRAFIVNSRDFLTECAHQRLMSTTNHNKPSTIAMLGETHRTDEWTNVSPRILEKLGKNLHNKKHHPLNLIRQRIVNYFYSNFSNRYGNPLFTVFDNISPVVTSYQNFDSVLTPKCHPSRSKRDTYYINSECLLRSHTSAHQEELIKMGFDAFLVVGDVFRRDEIDSSHYPVFHQMEGVRLLGENEAFSRATDPTGLTLFEKGKKTEDKQAGHTLDAAKLVEFDLKQTLLGLANRLFGKSIEYRWVDSYFPFTHPSWELEIKYQDRWLETLGCGIMEQSILDTAGATQQIGWAFGLGLERLAMKLYNIPDIRLFWSDDQRFLRQFAVDNPEFPIKYKPISVYPPCVNDVSFWVPEAYCPNDFYDLVRNTGGDVVEQVSLIDEFVHPSMHKTSHCYRIIYRHMEKTFTQDEVNELHSQIAVRAAELLGVDLRR